MELAKNRPGKFKTSTYGSPTFSNEKGERYRHPGDVVSIFDRGAINVPLDDFNPLDPLTNHTYNSYSGQGVADIGNFGGSFSYSHRNLFNKYVFNSDNFSYYFKYRKL